MQKVINEKIKIISDWQMYQECGVSLKFFDDTTYSETYLLYTPFSIDRAKESIKSLDEDYGIDNINAEYVKYRKMYQAIIDYFYSLGFKEEEDVLICLD